jgi:hypothetical protein
MNPTLSHNRDNEDHLQLPKRQKIRHSNKENGLPYDRYTIAWICALYIETTAAIAMLDEKHGELPRCPNDDNAYTLGSIKNHNIVIASLPQGQYGNNNAVSWIVGIEPGLLLAYGTRRNLA